MHVVSLGVDAVVDSSFYIVWPTRTLTSKGDSRTIAMTAVEILPTNLGHLITRPLPKVKKISRCRSRVNPACHVSGGSDLAAFHVLLVRKKSMLRCRLGG